MTKQLYIRGAFKVKQNISLFFILVVLFIDFPNNIVFIDIDKSMLSRDDKKYDIGFEPLTPLRQISFFGFN